MWQNVLLCHIPKLQNYLGLNEILGLWQSVLPHNFATKLIVEISLQHDLSLAISTKFQRNFNEFSTKVFCGKKVWQNILPQTPPRISNELFFDTPNERLPYTRPSAKHVESHSKICLIESGRRPKIVQLLFLQLLDSN